MKASELLEDRKAAARILSSPDGKKLMERLERLYVWGDAPVEADALQRWMGRRDVVLELKAVVNEAERTGVKNG